MLSFHCLYSTPNLALNLQKLQSFHGVMEFDFNFYFTYYCMNFSILKSIHKKFSSFESSIDKDKDAPIWKYKPEAMCKTYVVIIHAVVLSISMRWFFSFASNFMRPKAFFLHNKTTTWFHEAVRHNDLCCCFVDFQYLNFSFAFATVPAGSSWTKTTWRTFCFPPSVASMDEVIHSAPWSHGWSHL